MREICTDISFVLLACCFATSAFLELKAHEFETFMKDNAADTRDSIAASLQSFSSSLAVSSMPFFSAFGWGVVRLFVQSESLHPCSLFEL